MVTESGENKNMQNTFLFRALNTSKHHKAHT